MPTYNPNDFYPRTGQEVKSDGTTVNEADGLNTDGSQNISIVKRNQTVIQAIANQIVALSGNYTSNWFSTNGLDKIVISLMNDAGTANYADVHWSYDGSTYQNADYNAIPNNSTSKKNTILDVKAPYVRVMVYNGDSTAAHVMNAWFFLKA